MYLFQICLALEYVCYSKIAFLLTRAYCHFGITLLWGKIATPRRIPKTKVKIAAPVGWNFVSLWHYTFLEIAGVQKPEIRKTCSSIVNCCHLEEGCCRQGACFWNLDSSHPANVSVTLRAGMHSCEKSVSKVTVSHRFKRGDDKTLFWKCSIAVSSFEKWCILLLFLKSIIFIIHILSALRFAT